MFRKLRPRSAYDVMAAIAFFAVVAGGSAYAAATIGSNSIKNDAVLSRHIKNGAVQNGDLGADSVGSGKVIDGSLQAGDLAPGVLGRNPSSFNYHSPIHGLQGFYPYGGSPVSMEVSCNFPQDTAPVRIGLQVDYLDGGATRDLEVIGIVVHDHQVETPHVVRHKTSDGPPTWWAEANGALDIDVIARATGGQWTQYKLSAGWGGNTGCNYGGVIVPPGSGE